VAIAVTPDGRTAYVVNFVATGNGTVTPITTATNTPGKPIKAGTGPRNLVIVP
jgi:DNA-binding beta-propeller fold protein YncE